MKNNRVLIVFIFIILSFSKSISQEQGDYVNVNGIKIFYHTSGKGKPLFILHGGPGMPHNYFHPFLDTLKTITTLIFFDQRGTGQSAKAKNLKDYTIENIVNDIEEMRKFFSFSGVSASDGKYNKISLLGHAFGGMVALQYAITYPQNVEKLILVCTSASMQERELRMKEIFSTLSDSVKLKIVEFEKIGIFDKNGNYKLEYDKITNSILLPFMFRSPEDAKLLPKLNQSLDVYRQIWSDKSKFKITGNLKNFDVRKKLNKISSPTLVMYGNNELTSEASAETIAKSIKNSKLVLFSQSKHFPFIEERERFIITVRSFMYDDALPPPPTKFPF
jgi:proline iminopeptidase